MKSRVYALLFTGLMFFSGLSRAEQQALPNQHTLKQNEAGEYFVVNQDDIIMIEPSIIKIGHSQRWIVACIENQSIDTESKRMMFIDLKTTGATDTINQENWAYFSQQLEGLAEVELSALQAGDCP